jgi:hypothetical protein
MNPSFQIHHGFTCRYRPAFSVPPYARGGLVETTRTAGNIRSGLVDRASFQKLRCDRPVSVDEFDHSLTRDARLDHEDSAVGNRSGDGFDVAAHGGEHSTSSQRQHEGAPNSASQPLRSRARAKRAYWQLAKESQNHQAAPQDCGVSAACRSEDEPRGRRAAKGDARFGQIGRLPLSRTTNHAVQPC